MPNRRRPDVCAVTVTAILTLQKYPPGIVPMSPTCIARALSSTYQSAPHAYAHACTRSCWPHTPAVARPAMMLSLICHARHQKHEAAQVRTRCDARSACCEVAEVQTWTWTCLKGISSRSICQGRSGQIAMPRMRKHIVRQCAHAVSRGTAAFHGSPRPLSVSAPLLPPCDQDTRHVRPRCECPMSQVHSSPRQADRAPMIQRPRTLASIPKTQPWSPSQTKGPRTISHRDCPARTPAGFDSMLTRTPALRTHPASTQICSRLVSLL